MSHPPRITTALPRCSHFCHMAATTHSGRAVSARLGPGSRLLKSSKWTCSLVSYAWLLLVKVLLCKKAATLEVPARRNQEDRAVRIGPVSQCELRTPFMAEKCALRFKRKLWQFLAEAFRVSRENCSLSLGITRLRFFDRAGGRRTELCFLKKKLSDTTTWCSQSGPRCNAGAEGDRESFSSVRRERSDCSDNHMLKCSCL